MKKILLLFFTIIALFIPVSGICGESTGTINFAIGMLRTDDDFSKAFSLNEKIEIGVTCDMKNKNWPVRIAFYYIFSYGNSKTSENFHELQENQTFDLYCTETYLGIKKVFNNCYPIKPFFGGGIYTVNIYADISYDHDRAYGIGGWIGAGAYHPLTKHLNIGFEWRWSKAKISLFGIDLDIGGNHFNLLIGYHF